MKKLTDISVPFLFTVLLVVEMANYFANPSDPAYQLPLPFYALMACVWSWLHWDLNRDYEDICKSAKRLIEIADELAKALFSITKKEDGKRD